MKQRSALLGTSAGVWAERRPDATQVERMMASQAARQFVAKEEAIASPENKAGGAEQARE